MILAVAIEQSVLEGVRRPGHRGSLSVCWSLAAGSTLVRDEAIRTSHHDRRSHSAELQQQGLGLRHRARGWRQGDTSVQEASRAEPNGEAGPSRDVRRLEPHLATHQVPGR